MNKKKIILIGTIIVLLMILIIFLVGRSFGFFRYVKEGEIVNIITISGIKVEVLNPTDDALNLENAYPMYDSEGLTLTPFEFSMTNTSKKKLNYSIKIENDTEKQEACKLEDGTICPALTTNYIKFVYKQNDGTYSEPKLLSSTGGVIASGEIAGGETLTSSVILWIDSEAGNEIQNHYFFGKLLITGEQQTVLTFKDTILANNKLIEKEPDLTTSSNNTTDASGLYMSTATNTEEPTYYFRGNVENNYVEFAGFTWRIVRVNEDGTVRLVMTNGINNNAAYAFNANYNNYKYMYYSNNSNAKTQLETWYNSNLINYSDYIATGDYYCEQSKVKFPNATTGSATAVVPSSYNSDFRCEEDGNGYGIVNSNIGLITYDEVLHAGGFFNVSNTNYYLYDSNYIWFTMTPSGYNTSTGITCNWGINNLEINQPSGGIGYYGVQGARILKPVINLKTDTVATGSGTITDPYKVKVQETDTLTIGQAVTATDGSKWHVLEASGSDSKYVTLLSDYNLNTDGTYNTECGRDINSTYRCSTIAFDTSNSNIYDETVDTNIGYFIKNTYKPLVTNTLDGTTNVTLPTVEQIALADDQTFNETSITLTSSWLLTTDYWTKITNTSVANNVWNINSTNSKIDWDDAYFSNRNGARPVITTLKTNLIYE